MVGFYDFKDFADLISYYRAIAGMNQEDVAKKAKLSRVTICNAESGKKTTFQTKIKIMKALNVPTEIVKEFVKYN